MPNRPKNRSRERVPYAREKHWLVNQMSVGNLVSAGSVIVALTGFYFTTQGSLETQAKAIGKIEQRMSETSKELDRKEKSNDNERDKMRQEMAQRAEKTAEGIAELNKTTAVLSTQLTTISNELVKVGNQITSFTANASRR